MIPRLPFVVPPATAIERLPIGAAARLLAKYAVTGPGQSRHFWYASGMETYEQDAVFGTPTVALMEHFSQIDDPRRDHGKRHVLEEILVLTICAVICGADSFVQ